MNYLSRPKNQRGEIATILTLISVGLMLMGVVVGNVAVQQTTRTQPKASSTDDTIPTEPPPAAPPPATTCTGECRATICLDDEKVSTSDGTCPVDKDFGQLLCCVKQSAPPPAEDEGNCIYADKDACEKPQVPNEPGCLGKCKQCTNGKYACIPKANEGDCPKNGRDKSGLCNPACCGEGAPCPSGETCGVPNGYCVSGKSCAPPAPGSTSPKYVRMCLGSTCAWTFCDGKNVDPKICTGKDPLSVKDDDPSTLCDSNEFCKTLIPTAAPNVNKCIDSPISKNSVDCPRTYPECYASGKAVLVHRDCTQSNTSGCVYWCESKTGGRTGCRDPDAKTFDDPSCDGDKDKAQTQICYPYQCPDNSEKEFSVKNRQLFDSSDCSGNPVTSYSLICRGPLDACDFVSGGSGKGKCVGQKSDCPGLGSGYTGRAFPRWGPPNNDVDIPLCSAQNENLCCEPNTGPKGGFTPKALPSIAQPPAAEPPGTVTVGDADTDCQFTLPRSIAVNTPFEVSVKKNIKTGEPTSVKLGFKKGSENPILSGGATVIYHLLNGTTTTNRPTKPDCDRNPEPDKCFSYVTWKFTDDNKIKLTQPGTYNVSFGFSGGSCQKTATIGVKTSGTSDVAAPAAATCSPYVSTITPDCTTCLKGKLSSDLNKMTCSEPNQKINELCNYSVTTNRAKCDQNMDQCTSCTPSDKNQLRIPPPAAQSYTNDSFAAVVEARRLNQINAIYASLYVLNATRVPGLQRLYCDPFKGQCDFYYQQQLGT